MAKARVSDGKPSTAFALEVSIVVGRDGKEYLYLDRVDLTDDSKALIIKLRSKRARALAQWILDHATE